MYQLSNSHVLTNLPEVNVTLFYLINITSFWIYSTLHQLIQRRFTEALKEKNVLSVGVSLITVDTDLKLNLSLAEGEKLCCGCS